MNTIKRRNQIMKYIIADRDRWYFNSLAGHKNDNRGFHLCCFVLFFLAASLIEFDADTVRNFFIGFNQAAQTLTIAVFIHLVQRFFIPQAATVW